MDVIVLSLVTCCRDDSCEVAALIDTLLACCRDGDADVRDEANYGKYVSPSLCLYNIYNKLI